MSRAVDYRWHLRLRMAERGMFATTELGPLLAERGVKLSREQVYRLVAGTPERMSLHTLAALCDILDCDPSDIVEVTAEPRSAAKRATVSKSAPKQKVRHSTHTRNSRKTASTKPTR